jgi:hypothetical protein
MTAQPYAPPAPQAYQQPMRGLSFLVHGHAKAGKSTFADSGPRPTVILDVEGTSIWTPSRKTEWNPLRETVPDPGRHLTAGYGQPSITPGWESAMVIARDAETTWTLYQILNTGRHPFNSVSVDSVTEVQQREIDDLTKGKAMGREQWGELLRYVNRMTRMYRDLITHPVKPLWSVAMTAGTHQVQGRWRPLLQGASQDYLPYYVDLLGYLNARQDGVRELLTGPHPSYETGERIGGRLPFSMQIGDGVNHQGYTITTMLQQVLQGR